MQMSYFLSRQSCMYVLSANNMASYPMIIVMRTKTIQQMKIVYLCIYQFYMSMRVCVQLYLFKEHSIKRCYMSIFCFIVFILNFVKNSFVCTSRSSNSHRYSHCNFAFQEEMQSGMTKNAAVMAKCDCQVTLIQWREFIVNSDIYLPLSIRHLQPQNILQIPSFLSGDYLLYLFHRITQIS